MACVTSLSIVIDNYNYADFLPAAIDSVLRQREDSDQIVIVDDGSTDGSRDLLRTYKGLPGIRILEQNNQGQLGALLDGLECATGDMALLLDSDDYYLPGYLDRIRALAKVHPDIDLFFSAPRLGGNCSPKALESIGQSLARMEIEPGPTGPSKWAALYTGEYLGSPTSGLALRRRLVERILAVRDRLDDRCNISKAACRLFKLPRDSHSVRRLAADTILVGTASAIGSLKYYEPEQGFFYRIHGSNAYARLGTLGRLYLRFVHARKLSGMLRSALDASSPCPPQVVREAALRSLPCARRRRARLTLNYMYTALRCEGSRVARLGAALRMARFVSDDRRSDQ